MTDKPVILCTICARGGSKGLKDKNVLKLAGKPLIAYTIEHAFKWGKARRVVVSTDSEKIADAARRYGAEVPFVRPKALASDNAPKLLSIRHALNECERIFGDRYDIVVDLDVSAPVRRISDLDNCLAMFMKKRPLTLFSVVKARKNPYFNMVEENKDGYFQLSKKMGRRVSCRQAAPRVYSMNASIYFYAREFLLDEKNTMPFSKRTITYLMDDVSSYDIDSMLDFKFIEFLIKKRIWRNGL